MASVPKSVPSAVPSSATAANLPENTGPQLGPYNPMTGSSVNPVVPRSDNQAQDGTTPQPGYGRAAETGSEFQGGGTGAPSVPGMNGILFRKSPIDSHYVSQAEGTNPYSLVNNPSTRGMNTFVVPYQNHIAQTSQDVDANGFRNSPAQQRQSVMRFQPPPHADGYAPQSYTPRQMPAHARQARFQPVIGTDPPSSGVLNSSTFGAGQTAGGIGGSNYTPTPGPPVTQSTAGNPAAVSAEPTWG